MVEKRKSVLRSVRLDDDVWEAVKGMGCSLNQYLRIALLGNDVQPKRLLTDAHGPHDLIPPRPSGLEGVITVDPVERSATVNVMLPRPFKAPLLKPSERGKK